MAALATAMTGNNPISGMTLVTLIIGSSALVAVGLQGEFGKYAAIVMGAVVCTSLSMAGGFVTDLKVGYWLGSTPRYQQLSKVDRHAVRRRRRGAAPCCSSTRPTVTTTRRPASSSRAS